MTPLLPLESFREIIGYHPFFFWGLAGQTVPVNAACNGLVAQHAWQNADAVGRQEISEAIETAEARLREYLGFSVAPRYTEAVDLAYPHYLDRALHYVRMGIDGHWIPMQLPEGQIRAMGVESLTLLGTQTLTFSDSDGDGVADTFVTAALATTVTDSDDIAVYFKAADRLDSEAVGDRWRIEPVQVTISGGNVIIKGKKWLCVKPIKYEGITSNDGLDPATTANFVTELEVYKRVTNQDGTTIATSQGVLTWEPGAGCCSGGDSSTDPGAIATAVARVGIRDAEVGVVFPGQATYDTTTGLWAGTVTTMCRTPDRVTLRYLAGLPLESDGRMNRAWATVVARLAAAELDRPICGCETANRTLYRWQTDLARTGGNNDESFGAISAADLDNPLGTRRGHIYAWNSIMNARQARGFLP